MSLTYRFAAFAAVILLASCASTATRPPAAGSEPGIDSAWAEAVAGLEHRPGLLDLYVDTAENRVLLALPAPGESGSIGQYLYLEGLTTGLGSNPVGLDRGQLGDSRLLDLRRLGKKVLFEQPNLRYRALTDDAAEARATRQAFATSVLWAGEAAVVTDDGRALIDITSFLVRDAHGVSQTLEAAQQGSFRLDGERSTLDTEACLAFPDNLEFEAILTFAGDRPGDHVRQTAPTPQAITLVQHHSLVRLPDDGYRPRDFDPRMGSFAVSFLDYAAPLGAPMEKQWIVRHRLERTDPTAARSAAKEPLVYYVDPGTPEPIRSALVDGASWWAQAFEQAGFDDAYRVEILPEDVHPLDVRYNVIQWVHRSTRGWSYGGGVVDPRTGEMIKGHVSLGSLRVRQDILLFEGLVGAAASGSGDANDPIEVALARIRQLAAHEVGHTLGFNHNFAASTYGRASVMDYPAPWARLKADGAIDLSEAYGVGLGSWDLAAGDFAYREFPDATSRASGLAAIIDRALDEGLVFLTDADARPPGAAHPQAGLWDNGEDSVAALAETLAVRRVALDRFGAHNLAPGRPMARLEEVLAPLYFHHRYQLGVTAKMVGGLDYRYKVRGDSQHLPAPIPGERQHAALTQVLEGLTPSTLELPPGVLAVMHPRDAGSGPNRELFRGLTSPVFDPVGAAATAAAMAASALTAPERINRLAIQHAMDPAIPSPTEVLSAMVGRAFGADGSASDLLSGAVQDVVVEALVRLAADADSSLATRLAAEQTLDNLPTGAPGSAYLARAASRWLQRAHEPTTGAAAAPAAPPGSPIGTDPGPSAGGGLPLTLMTCSQWQDQGGAR